MVFTLTWLGSAVFAPGFRGQRALRRGQTALQRRNYADARKHLEKAASFPPLREEALCLLAEAALHAHRPSDALHALNTLLLDHDALGSGSRPRSPRVRLLRGIAGCMVGRPAAARRELAAIPRESATLDDLLAAAQACVMSGDEPGALRLLEALDQVPLAPPLLGRVKLCRAALHYRMGDHPATLAALPPDEDCGPADATVARRIRAELTPVGQASEPSPP